MSVIFEESSSVVRKFFYGFIDRLIDSAIESNILSEDVNRPRVRRAIIGVGAMVAAGAGAPVARHVSLRLLLHYRGWMHSPKSKMTKLWGLTLYVLTGNLFVQPTTYKFQNILPRLPLPSLKDTVERYAAACEQVLSREEMVELHAQIDELLNGRGPQLQRFLWLNRLTADNWVAEAWERFVYLAGRKPLLVNSNFYISDAPTYEYHFTQCARASIYILSALKAKQALENGTFQPLLLNFILPICMDQYRRIFNTCRIPGETEDTIFHVDPPQAPNHIVVLCRGAFYKVVPDIEDPYELQCQLEWIMQDAQANAASEAENLLPTCTAQQRTLWWELRNKLRANNVNRASLDDVEKSVFMVSLDHDSYDPLPVFSRAVFTGNGHNRWFDKSFTIVVSANARAGYNVDHSWADAPTIAHIWEFAQSTEGRDYEHLIGEDGRFRPTPNKSYENFKSTRLSWQVDEHCELFRDLDTKAVALGNDVEMEPFAFKSVAKGFIKKCGVSPDGFVQCALQLAYLRDQKKFAHTYESATTRLFYKGRTETVRSLTKASAAFVKSMDDPRTVKATRKHLLERACKTHSANVRTAMVGQGCDRHLFGLYVAARWAGGEVPRLLDNYVNTQWELSTSQSPIRQMVKKWDPDDDRFRGKISIGGGFGPVAQHGYGVSYFMIGNHTISFHITCWKSSSKTDASRFRQRLCEALLDMASLHDDKFKRGPNGDRVHSSHERYDSTGDIASAEPMFVGLKACAEEPTEVTDSDATDID